jgi:Flp pilus assembly protein protease CpaA
MLLVTGLIRAGSMEGALGPPAYLLRMALVILIFYPFFQIGALGAGDVKLFGIAAGFFENRDVIPFLFFTLLIAAMISLVKLLKNRRLRERFARLALWAQGIRSRDLRMYVTDEEKTRADTVALAGPVLCGILLKMGGFY